jgi:uncharacterized protein (TIGR03435 family)
VVDGTGLQGVFDWEIQWSPEPQSPDNASPATGPTLLTALNEQAYLRLQATQQRVDLFVVGRVEHHDPD